MLTRIDHIGIACFDLDKTVEFYRSTYGFEVFHSEINEEQGVREAMLKINDTSDGGASYLRAAGADAGGLGRGQVAGEERGGRPPHRLRYRGRRRRRGGHPGEGVRVLYDEPRTGSMGSRITFLHPKDCHGVLTELVTSAAEH